MKPKDFALIGIIVLVSAVVSLFASKAIFASPANRQQQVSVVQPIDSDFPAPPAEFFNNQSVDPAVTITIGQNNNADPFSGN